MNPIRVFISGPYSSSPEANTDAAIAVAELLHSFGFVPFVPHLSHFWDRRYPHPYTDWLAYDLHWLCVCDAVFRMPGESAGADGEVAEAGRSGIPVFSDIDELRAFAKLRTLIG